MRETSYPDDDTDAAPFNLGSGDCTFRVPSYADALSRAHTDQGTVGIQVVQPIFKQYREVKAKAEVIVVVRSESNLSVGDRITIKYTHDKLRKNWVGPRPIPMLKKHTETDAFLTFDTDRNWYVPSARGASFDPLIRE